MKGGRDGGRKGGREGREGVRECYIGWNEEVSISKKVLNTQRITIWFINVQSIAKQFSN